MDNMESFVDILQEMIAEQEARRKKNPVQVPFGAGTPTLGKKQLDQEAALAAKQLALEREKMAQEAALAREQMALQKSLASMGGGGGGGGGGGSGSFGTAGQMAAVATATLLQAGHNRYAENKGKFKYPLYYTLNSIMNDPKVNGAARAAGADIQSVVDQLIRSYTSYTPSQYFKTNTGKKLKSSYDALSKSSKGGSSYPW